MIPYLARVLGPSGWGHIAFAQSMGDFIAIFAEYGFVLSATRELAQNHESKEECRVIASGTFGAQAVLVTLGVTGAILVSFWVPFLRSHPKLLCAGLVYGAAQGLSPNWLFQGLERMTVAAVLEVLSKLAALVSVFVFVHSPGDEWKVLAFQGFAPVVAAIAGIWLAHRVLRLQVPSLAMVMQALRMGWSMFLLRSGIAAFSTANIFILGVFARADLVGYYASADKIAKAIGGLTMPIGDAFYPRLSKLAVHSPSEGRSLTRMSVAIQGVCGLLLTIATFWGASPIIRLVYGKTFGGAVPILQLLAILPLVIALTDSIGFQSLLPAKRENSVTKAILAGAIVNISLAFLLAPRFGGIGMASAAAIAETTVCIILIWIVARTTTLFTGNEVQPAPVRFAVSSIEVSSRTAK